MKILSTILCLLFFSSLWASTDTIPGAVVTGFTVSADPAIKNTIAVDVIWSDGTKNAYRGTSANRITGAYGSIKYGTINISYASGTVVIGPKKIITKTMATYYVSNSGSDSANGTSSSTPWQTIAKVNASSFSAGDSILLKRGDTWREQLTIPSSGSSGNRITFGAYGTGAKPIINAADIKTGWTNAGGNIWYVTDPNTDPVFARTVVAVDGSLYNEVASLAALTSPRKYFLDASPTPDRVYVYSTVDPSTVTTEVTARKYGIVTASGSSSKRFIAIDNIEVRFAGRAGIYFEGPGSSTSDALDGNSTVTNCTVYGNRNFGIAHYDHYDNLTVEDCEATFNGNAYYSWVADEGTFRRCYSANSVVYSAVTATDGHGFGGYQSDNWLVEHCISVGDADNIHIDCGGLGVTGTMRYNKAYNGQAGSPNTPCMGWGSLGAGGTLNIYYNLLVNGASAAVEVFSSQSGTINFYNNTMYCSNTTGSNGIFNIQGSTTNYNIKNNLFLMDYVAAKRLYIQASGAPTSLDNNLYWIYNAVGATMRNLYGSDRTTLSAWKTATGKDANALNTDPLLVNLTNDWSLQSGSPARGAGANVGLTQDINGTALPSTPDIGAFQYREGVAFILRQTK